MTREYSWLPKNVAPYSFSSQAAAVKVLKKDFESTLETEVKAMLAVEMEGVPGVPRLLGYKKNFLDGRDVLVMEYVGRYGLEHVQVVFRS